MNYLAEGLNQGFALGASARQKKEDREEADRLAKARAALELDMLAKRAAADKALQNDRLVADAQKQFSGQGWQSGESEKDRAARLALQTGAQGFQGGQSNIERAVRAAALDKEMTLRKQLADAELTQRGTLGAAGLGLRAREIDQQGKALAARYPEDDLDPAATTTRPVIIYTQEEYNRLPQGARFNWNGRSGRKP